MKTHTGLTAPLTRFLWALCAVSLVSGWSLALDAPEELPTVLVLATGGTIAGVQNDPNDPARYKAGSLTAEEILASVPGLGEHAIRDLNDEINKKLREKHHWNKRIYALGGLDYVSLEKKRQIEEGGDDYMADPGGYKYFGAAKDLPGVKEILAKQAQKAVKKKDAWRNITPDYFGWRDEDYLTGGTLCSDPTCVKETGKEKRGGRRLLFLVRAFHGLSPFQGFYVSR